jgi:flagellar biosynthesis protein FlhA
MDTAALIGNLKQIRPENLMGLGTPLMLVLLLAMMIIPLPALALDIMFTFNITLSLVVMLVVLYAVRPLEFSVFPSLLLVVTLFRLALNIASTRVVLLEGHNGGDAAGKVIEAFGAFVIGGNFAVGLVVFAILIIINFVVITKGAGRVSEVSARFTLDAMPGKQMAIDADLNTGMIDHEEARRRRQEIAAEAEFYGSMDGASKFVRGDAMAGLLILAINVIGGLIIGMMQHDLDFATAIDYYVLLTIGDGLVAQIPALLLSTATAIIVTRVSSSQDNLGGQVMQQLFNDHRSLAVSGAILGGMGLVPGMPNLAFLSLGALSGAAAWYVKKRNDSEQLRADAGPALSETQPEVKELSWDDVPPVDIIGLEVGYRLIPLVDRNQGGQLMNRIKGVRKKLSQDLGFLVQPVHIRDNLDLTPIAYRITLHGVPVAEAEVQPDMIMAINPGQVYGSLQGINTKDPAFGLDAVWVMENQREQAQSYGYTVVDAGTVVATHLSEILSAHAHELLGHEEVQKLLENLERVAPKLVEDLVPKTLTVGKILKILQNLLSEGVPIRDMRSIAETLAEHGATVQDTGVLTAQVRIALSRSIVQQIAGPVDEIPVAVLEPGLEQILLQGIQGADGTGVGFEPGLAERLQDSLMKTAQTQSATGEETILLVAAGIRPWMARFVKHSVAGIHVLSYNEIPENRRIRVVATIGQQNGQQKKK